MTIDLDDLVRRAIAMRSRAHAPYSRFTVGAAVQTASGDVFEGCNVENASYGAGICAERTAIVKMVAAGAKDPIICVIATRDDPPAAPCGICRQTLTEFAADMRIVLVSDISAGPKRVETTLAALLPMAFRFDRGGAGP